MIQSVSFLSSLSYGMLLGKLVQKTSRPSVFFLKVEALGPRKRKIIPNWLWNTGRNHSMSSSKLLRSFFSSNLSRGAHQEGITSHQANKLTVKLPSQRMAVSPDGSLLVLAYSSHLQVFDLSTCTLLSSTNYPDLNPSGSNHTALIKLLLVHQDHSLSDDRKRSTVLISTGEDRLLKTWELPSLRLINSRELIKRAISIAVSPEGEDIVIADKFGDVYNLPLDAPSGTILQSNPDQKETAATAEPAAKLNPKTDSLKKDCKPVVPIAGHVSLITSLTFIPSQPNPLLVTADRDEHIRLSRYPRAWSIFSYLLGHRKFVASLLWVDEPCQQQQQQPETEKEVASKALRGRLLSAGGDDEIYVWDHVENMCVKKISVKGLTDGMKVWPHKRTWFSKTRSNKRRHKTLDSNHQNNDNLNQSSNLEGENQPPQENQSAPEAAETEQPSQPFVQMTCVSKMICTPPSKQAGPGYVLATSVGSSTLAAIPLSCIFDSQTGCLETTKYHDVGLPILDIVGLSDHHVLLSMDNSFSPTCPDQSSSSPRTSFRILTLFPDKIEELSNSAESTLASLNQLASLEVSTESYMPSQENLYSELILFTKDDINSTTSHLQNSKLKTQKKKKTTRRILQEKVVKKYHKVEV